ncbi:MAG: hypothetical protein EOP10_03145 [Proteobacteria bacterium]|nr:MAG: hypothetical protein EOP10_03145 [Pseudomonadota bacterium]
MTQKSSHRVAKRMIERLEQKEKIQIDHLKFARLTLDKSLRRRQPWMIPGGPRVEVEECYSITFWRAMNTPSEDLVFQLRIKSFDGDEIQQSKALARSGRDIARKLMQSGLFIRHEVEIGLTPHHTVNTFDFRLLAHHSTYRALLLPTLKILLKPFMALSSTQDIQLSVAHPRLEEYARFVVQSAPAFEPSHPTPYF